MGNSNQKRIVILDDSENKEDKYSLLYNNSNLSLVLYNKFDTFIEK